MTKTEEALLDKLSKKGNGRVSVLGKREVNAAKKLLEKGLIEEFINQSEYVPPQRSNRRKQNGDYVGVHFFGGVITTAV